MAVEGEVARAENQNELAEQEREQPNDNPPSETPKTKNAEKTKRLLSWSVLNLILDACLLVSVVGVVWVTAMMAIVFPRATLADGWSLWGLGFDQWRNLQTILMAIVAALATEHLILHWTWVCGVISTKILKLRKRPDEATQYMYGLALFYGVVVLMVAAVGLAMLTVAEPPNPAP